MSQPVPKAMRRGRPLRLGGVHEVAEILGITKAAIVGRRRRQAEIFPPALVELRCGPIFDLEDIERYRDRYLPGRGGYAHAPRRRPTLRRP